MKKAVDEKQIDQSSCGQPCADVILGRVVD